MFVSVSFSRVVLKPDITNDIIFRMKYFILIAVTALVTGLAVTAYFKGLFPQISFTKPQAVSVQSTEVAAPASSPIVSPNPSPNPVDENQNLTAAVKEGLVEKHGSDAASLNVTVSKIVGDYATGGAASQAGGGMWLAAKVNGIWKLVWDGNGTISCSSLDPYPAFPVSLVSECWDTVTNSLKTR